MHSFLSNATRPEGWLEWNADFALSTLSYGEYMNYGPGAGLGSRVKWPGYREGNLWLPPTGVKYTAGFGA
ncbi:hypothetical protein ACFX12_026789 [Malus domestica]